MLTRFSAFCVLFLITGPAMAQEAFDAFVRQAWPEAQSKGLTRATFDTAMKGVTPDQRVIDATRRQPEYGKPVGDYVAGIVSDRRVSRGQAKEKEWTKTFDAVEQRFQVERWILLALWGIESDFGAAKDKWDIFRSLATLGYVKYRHPYFRNELFVAMKIMQDNKFPREKMLSSWAGAIGQTQFMPSNVVDYAIDFSGDRKVDLWDSVPDILGSTGNYMRNASWQHGMPWGFEVAVPRNFDYMQSRGSFGDWTQRGVRRADGKPFPANGNGILFFPSGHRGPGFVVTENFDVLKAYNNSDAYAIAVGHLADRMQGAGPIRAKWPDERPLSRDARIALQKKLASLGYKVNDFQGRVDFDLRDNIRAEQKKLGMVPDGNPTQAFLDGLGVKVN